MLYYERQNELTSRSASFAGRAGPPEIRSATPSVVRDQSPCRGGVFLRSMRSEVLATPCPGRAGPTRPRFCVRRCRLHALQGRRQVSPGQRPGRAVTARAVPAARQNQRDRQISQPFLHMSFRAPVREKRRPTVDLAGQRPRGVAGLRKRKVRQAAVLQSRAAGREHGEMALRPSIKAPFPAIVFGTQFVRSYGVCGRARSSLA